MANEELSEQAFERAADATLRALELAISHFEESLECDLSSGILTIEFHDGTKYVINSHRAARQIWMAAERAAWHFDFSPEQNRWLSPKSGEELWATLEAIVARKLGQPFQLASTTKSHPAPSR